MSSTDDHSFKSNVGQVEEDEPPAARIFVGATTLSATDFWIRTFKDRLTTDIHVHKDVSKVA